MIFSKMARFIFYPTLLYNVVMEKISLRCWFNRIDKHVILGALPFRSMNKQLVEDEKVKGIITCNEDHELEYFVNTKDWAALGVAQLRLTCPDMVGSPSQEQLHRAVEFLNSFRNTENSVYVHCKAGRSRSATIVTCYLMQLHLWTPEEAVTYIKEKRPHIVIRSAQDIEIHQFYANNIKTLREQLQQET
ncbi:PREDICTED: phosphatidylglycerophosphatase and protein-tyrosine phosphatase 1-like isoform X2 [Priapulus caudatus]|uniref:Phosphatidylglycerophosphatase and protein-tyrosine phosphatase 1-like isoform X2 n=1 Tax=Priapulus caudatus TaxID=37621 RepID=A0ABM1FAQ0_PRICU|nr:PREDICTED: phosphatidylglycerophosphatase and protein-tyrosine phosphatase 1-like isoform X2 [Priapulus caudatus]